MAPRVSARNAVAALALLAGPGLTACSSPPPAPPQQPAAVETSVSTTYYSVRGTTTAAIFAAIDANGLVETSGQRAVGVTSADWKLTSGDVDVRAVPCVFPSLTVTLIVFALLLAAVCASAPAKPSYTAFDTIQVPKELEYRPDDSNVIETPEVRASRVLYRGRVDPETLASAMRSNLEADGWKTGGITTMGHSGSTQVYEKAGTSLQVRIWEGGPFSWYTYLELASVETLAVRPGPGVAPVPSSTPTPGAAPKPSASVIRDAPAPAVAR